MGGAGSGQVGTGQAFSLKLVRGGRVVGRRPPGFTAQARDFEPRINQGAYLYLVAKKVVGYGLGSWMVLLSVLTVLVKTDEDARARMEDEHPLLLAVCDYYASMFDRILADDGDDEAEQEAEDDEEEEENEEEEEEDGHADTSHAACNMRTHLMQRCRMPSLLCTLFVSHVAHESLSR